MNNAPYIDRLRCFYNRHMDSEFDYRRKKGYYGQGWKNRPNQQTPYSGDGVVYPAAEKLDPFSISPMMVRRK